MKAGSRRSRVFQTGKTRFQVQRWFP